MATTNLILSPYRVHWIEFRPVKGIVTKHDKKVLSKGHALLLGKGDRQHFEHCGTKENALAYIESLRGKKLDKHYICYIFTDKQFSLATTNHGFTAIPYTTKQKAVAITL